MPCGCCSLTAPPFRSDRVSSASMAARFAVPLDPPRISFAEANAIFKRLQSLSDNKRCFVCSARKPMWASLAFGVFLCIECAGAHRSQMWRGRGAVRSCTVDTWDQEQMLRMVCGGNARAQVFWAKASSQWTPRCGGCNRDVASVRCASCVMHLCAECNKRMHSDIASGMPHGPAVPVARNALTKPAIFTQSLGRDYQRSLDEEVEKQRDKLLPTLNGQFGLEQPDLKEEAAAEEPVTAASPAPTPSSSSGPLSAVLSLFRDG